MFQRLACDEPDQWDIACQKRQRALQAGTVAEAYVRPVEAHKGIMENPRQPSAHKRLLMNAIRVG